MNKLTEKDLQLYIEALEVHDSKEKRRTQTYSTSNTTECNSQQLIETVAKLQNNAGQEGKPKEDTQLKKEFVKKWC